MGRNLPRFVQYTQTFHLLFLPEVDTSTINNPAVSAHPRFWGRFSPPRHSTILGLASTHNICDLLMINPLFTLCQDSCMIHSKSRDSHLVLDRVFILTFLRVFRKGELNLCLSLIFTRHDDGGKKEQKAC